MSKLAEDCNYWKSSNTAPDSWLQKTLAMVVKFGGIVLGSGYADDNETGRSAFLIRFTLEGETFRILWPVLQSKSGDATSARRQAATMMYHDVKAKCGASQSLGVRVAFFAWVELADGRSACELATTELIETTPEMFSPKASTPLIAVTPSTQRNRS